MQLHVIDIIKGESVKVCINDQTGNAALSIGNIVLSISPSKQNDFIVGIRNFCEEFSVITMNGGDYNLIDHLMVKRYPEISSYGRCYALVCPGREKFSLLSLDSIIRLILIFTISLNKHFPDLDIGEAFTFDEIESKKFWSRIYTLGGEG